RAQDSRQSQVEPEIGQTTLDILRAMLREARSEDGAVNSSLEQGSVARSAPTERPNHELGAVMNEKTPRFPFKRSKSSFGQGAITPGGRATLDKLRAMLTREPLQDDAVDSTLEKTLNPESDSATQAPASGSVGEYKRSSSKGRPQDGWKDQKAPKNVEANSSSLSAKPDDSTQTSHYSATEKPHN
ncbi:hypothetical protein DFH06DRAFT_1188446, partial [Mycena polygramma]